MSSNEPTILKPLTLMGSGVVNKPNEETGKEMPTGFAMDFRTDFPRVEKPPTDESEDQPEQEGPKAEQPELPFEKFSEEDVSEDPPELAKTGEELDPSSFLDGI